MWHRHITAPHEPAPPRAVPLILEISTGGKARTEKERKKGGKRQRRRHREEGRERYTYIHTLTHMH